MSHDEVAPFDGALVLLIKSFTGFSTSSVVFFCFVFRNITVSSKISSFFVCNAMSMSHLLFSYGKINPDVCCFSQEPSHPTIICVPIFLSYLYMTL
jgi:hypothetical protein